MNPDQVRRLLVNSFHSPADNIEGDKLTATYAAIHWWCRHKADETGAARAPIRVLMKWTGFPKAKIYQYAHHLKRLHLLEIEKRDRVNYYRLGDPDQVRQLVERWWSMTTFGGAPDHLLKAAGLLPQGEKQEGGSDDSNTTLL